MWRVEEHVWKGSEKVESVGFGRVAIIWSIVLESREVLSQEELTLWVLVCAGKRRMSNARVMEEMEAGRLAAGGRGGAQSGRNNGGEGNTCRVLDPNRNPRTLVVIIHEEAVNQFPGMAYYRGVFSEGEVSVRAMSYSPEEPYPVRATINVAGL
jgi:hypothetical protein